jgi:hypothetical protein
MERRKNNRKLWQRNSHLADRESDGGIKLKLIFGK